MVTLYYTYFLSDCFLINMRFIKHRSHTRQLSVPSKPGRGIFYNVSSKTKPLLDLKHSPVHSFMAWSFMFEGAPQFYRVFKGAEHSEQI